MMQLAVFGYIPKNRQLHKQHDRARTLINCLACTSYFKYNLKPGSESSYGITQTHYP